MFMPHFGPYNYCILVEKIYIFQGCNGRSLCAVHMSLIGCHQKRTFSISYDLGNDWHIDNS